jgi:hypothetical protein
LGIWVESVPPQICGGAITFGLAVFCKIVLVASISRTKCGRADQSNATTPATCGDAIEVPLRLAKALSLPLLVERTLTPGADKFGLSRAGL